MVHFVWHHIGFLILCWIFAGLVAAWINLRTTDDYGQALSIIPDLIISPLIVAFGPIALALLIYDRYL